MSLQPALLVEVVRSGVVESVHYGHAVIVDTQGRIERAWGDPDARILPRSANKPFQAVGMVELGLDLPPHLLALACASHAGEAMHIEGVYEILATARLTADALRTPAEWPIDSTERDAWLLAGHTPSPIGMNCSGKHAAMLVTAAHNGWSPSDYLAPGHPLQRHITERFSALTGAAPFATATDGCGAPLLGTTVHGLARAMATLAADAARDVASPASRVLTAMCTHPEMVGGSRLPVTAFMRAVPGLTAKNGAEGVYVAALPDGRALAVKALDGSERAQVVGFAGVLEAAGVDPELLTDLRTRPILGGGQVVGEIRPARLP